MTYGRISKKQQEILDYMKNEILNRGFPPSVREICEAVNLKSTSSVHSHLEALEKNGSGFSRGPFSLTPAVGSRQLPFPESVS